MQFSLHSVSQKLGLGLAAFAENSSEAEMIAYGLEIFLGSVLKFIILFTTASFLGIINEVVLLLLVTGSIRILAGGAHCTAYYRCMITSTMVMVVLGGTIKAYSHLLIHYSNLILAVPLFTALFLYWRYSPQAPLNKPLPNTEAERRFRFLTVILSMVYAVVSLTLGINSWISWSIAAGMLWQAVTLTGPGHKLVCLADNVLTFRTRR